MPDEVVAQDAQVKRWLEDALPVLAGPLGLSQGMVSAGRRALSATPMDDLLRLAESLGLAHGEGIRRLVKEVPDVGQRLETVEGREALLKWEKDHRAAPVLKALGQAVEEVQAFWRGGGVPRRAVIRLLAILGVSPVIPGGDAIKVRLAQVLGAGRRDAASLMREVARLTVADEGVKLEQADEILQQEPSLAWWMEEFLSALEAVVLQSGPRGSSRGPLVESRLVSLLADLTRSALAWEAEHGLPEDREHPYG